MSEKRDVGATPAQQEGVEVDEELAGERERARSVPPGDPREVAGAAQPAADDG